MIHTARTIPPFVFAIVLALALTSCRPVRYISVETVRTQTDSTAVTRADSLIRLFHERETATVRDSVFIRLSGDTVYKEVWHTADRLVTVRDTVRDGRTRSYTRTVRDTIRVPCPVERELTRWERTKMDTGGIAIGCLVSMICITVIWLIRKNRKQ